MDQDTNRSPYSLLQNETVSSEGHLSVRSRMEALFDTDTFVPVGTVYKRNTDEFSSLPDVLEGVLCGYGSVTEHLVFAFSQNANEDHGAMTEGQADKICGVFSLAEKANAPVVAFFDCGGAKIYEGIRSLTAYSRVIAAANHAKKTVPTVAVIVGKCTGMTAVFAAAFDFVIATADAEFSLTPQFLSDTDVSSASHGKDNGFFDCAADETAAIEKAKLLLSLLPSRKSGKYTTAECGDDLSRETGLSEDFFKNEYDPASAPKALFDGGVAYDYLDGFADGLYCGVGKIAGVLCGVISAGKDRVSDRFCKKAKKFFAICREYTLPVIALADGGKYAPDTSPESVIEMAAAFESLNVPKITVITDAVHGVMFSAFASKALGADFVIALPDATASVMEPASAVEFLYRDEIVASGDPDAKRKALVAEYIEKHCSAKALATTAMIDDIVSAAELRMKLASLLLMLTYASK